MLEVNFVGCGRVGKPLARLMAEKKQATIKGIVNASLESGQKAIKFIGQGNAYRSFSQLPHVDVTFIATSDALIQTICEQLVAYLKPNSIVAHFSGALSAKILSSARSKNCSIVSIHPIRSFAEPEIAVTNFKGTYCSIEGDEQACFTLHRLFVGIGAEVIRIKSEDKAKYHTGLVIAHNYLISLHYLAATILSETSVDSTLIIKIISKLMQSGIKNINESGHLKALTGPIQRADIKTILTHMKVLRDNPVALRIYAVLGKATIPLTKHSEAVKQQLIEILNNGDDQRLQPKL